jgi:hypothetical protein
VPLPPEKLAMLQRFLATLSPERASELAAALSRTKVSEPRFPAELVLAALRRDDVMEKPSLRRLVCAGFEIFLTSDKLAAPIAGQISRRAIKPWWTALERMAGSRLRDLEAQLAKLQEEGRETEIFAAEARRLAAAWSADFVAGLRAHRRLVPELQNLFADDLVRSQVGDIAEVLRICEPLAEALGAVGGPAPIAELDDARVAEVKDRYLALAETLGPDTRWFILAIMNRLEKPWQILRLAQALGWTRDADVVRNAELTAICERLIAMLVDVAEQTSAATAEKTALSSGSVDYAELRRLVARYAGLADGLNVEVDFRRDSIWGAEIMRSRAKMRSSFDAERLQVVCNIVLAFFPNVVGAHPPPVGTIQDAREAATLLSAVAARGERHGFGDDAKIALGMLDKELERQTEALLAGPQDYEAQLKGAAEVMNALFHDIRSKNFARRIETALRERRRAPADFIQ